MKKILYNRPFLKKFLVSYIIILSIPFVLNVITFRSSTSVVKNYADKSNSAVISQIRYALDQRIGFLEDLVFQVSQNRGMDSLSKQINPVNDGFHLELIATMKEINTYMMLNNNIATDYYIIFLNSRYVIDGSTIIPFDIFFEYKYRYGDWGEEEWIGFLTESYHTGSFLESDNIRSGPQSYKGIPFVKTIPFYFNSTNSAFILFNIKESDIFSYFDPDHKGVKGIPVIVDTTTGNRIAGTGSEDIDSVLVSSESNKYGLSYRLIFQYKDVYKKLLMVRTIMLILNILVFVLSCFAAVYFAKLNANPLFSIYNMMKSNLPESDNKNTCYDYLTSSISQIITNNHSLESVVEDHKKIISAEFYNKLVKYGFNTPSEIISIRQYLDKPIQKGLSGVLLLNIPQNQFFETDSIYGEILETKISLIQALKDFSSFPDRWLDLDSLSIGYVFTIDGDDKELWFKESRNEILKLQRKLKNKRIPYFWTVGNPVDDTFNLNNSYQQARSVSEEISEYNEPNIYEYRNHLAVVNRYNLSIELIQKMINLAKSGETNMAIELFDENWHDNIIDNALSQRSKHIYFLELRSLLVRISPEITEAQDFFDFHLKGTDDIYNIVISSFKSLGVLIKQNNEKVSLELKKQLIEHLKDNFDDKNLSLCSIAEEFNKSESYISHFFKKYCSINFYSLLEQLRMEKAGELLRYSDFSIQDISCRIGYSSMHSFRRAFKKIHGVSPSSFRKI